jgi:flagellar basal-body rod protein FlgF
MIKGMYTSASGMIPRVQKQELVANNLANVNTAGFKKDRLFTKELSQAEKKVMTKRADWEQPMVDQLYVDYQSGIFDKTDNPLDVAIEGDGFFQLQAPDGSTALTRAGTFSVSQDGYLSFPGGYLVRGEGGAIQVGNGKVTIAGDGGVQVDGNQVDRIIPVSVNDVTTLQRLGGTLFRAPEGEELKPSVAATLRQGYLETANVDVVHEMVDMIISYRTYEANAKALQSQDTSLDNLFQRVGGS